MPYQFNLPEGSKDHPIFHASLHKKAVGDYHVEEKLTDHLEGDEMEQVEPEKVLSTRVVRQL